MSLQGGIIVDSACVCICTFVCLFDTVRSGSSGRQLHMPSAAVQVLYTNTNHKHKTNKTYRLVQSEHIVTSYLSSFLLLLLLLAASSLPFPNERPCDWMPSFLRIKVDGSWRLKLMAVLEDNFGSEHTLEKILKPSNAIWENGLGTKDTIILPGNCTNQRT